MMLLERTSEILTRAAVPHAVIGGLALASAGVARSTFDIDLLTTDPRALAPALWVPIREEGGIPDVQHGTKDDPLAGVVRLEMAGARPVDVMVGRERWMARAIERAVRHGDAPPVVQPHDIVLLKLYAGGTQDSWDILAVLALPTASAIVAQVDADVAVLPACMRRRWTDAMRARGGAPPETVRPHV